MTIDLKIKTIPVTVFEQNARILTCVKSNQTCVIDPGGDIDTILEKLPEKTVVTDILLTHCHLDHGGGVQDLINQLTKYQNKPVELSYHPNEIPIAKSIEQYSLQMGLPEGSFKNVPDQTKVLSMDEPFKIGELKFNLAFVPGHAPGHISLYADNYKWQHQNNTINNHPILIGGDVLFNGSIGRTDLPLANHQTLIDSIQTIFYKYPNETEVFTGHGPNTFIGYEKKNNPFVTAPN